MPGQTRNRPSSHRDLRLGRTLVIANPTASSGRGERAAAFAERFLDSYESATDGHELMRTRAAGDARDIATDAEGFDTVVALGGDGVIHETVNGLMALPCDRRPRLGVIPMGSGNDYARTLGMSRNDPDGAMRQLVTGAERTVELGLVNGTHFAQTLSFGLDAAIALDTTTKRENDTRQRGTELFVRSAIRILSHASEGFACEARFDDGERVAARSIIFAFQVGPTYGAGFRVCPSADPCDGMLDVCRNTRMPSVPGLMGLLAAARWGGHVRSGAIETRRVRHATLDFEDEPPCQVDGEGMRGTHFDIRVVPDALRVIFPTTPR